MMKVNSLEINECPIAAFLPFSGRYGSGASINLFDNLQRLFARQQNQFENNVDYPGQYNVFSPQSVSRLSYNYAATMMMAIEHFNNKNTSIVPELENLNDCPVQLSPVLVDSQADGKESVRQLWDLTASELTTPCAILGPLDEQANFDLIAAANAFDVPMVSYFVENELLVAKKGTLGMTLSLRARAKAMASYLEDREFLSIWHTATRQGSSLAQRILEQKTEKLEVKAFRDNFGEDITEKLERMKSSGFRTIFLSVWETAALPGYASKLDELGMLESEYVYFLAPDLVPTDTLETLYGEQIPGSPLDKLLSGALVFDVLDGYRQPNISDVFSEAYFGQSDEWFDDLNDAVPSTTFYRSTPEFFRQSPPANFASFMYDSVMTIGFGACNIATADNSSSLASPQERMLQLQTQDDFAAKGELLRQMKSISFNGASGYVDFGLEEEGDVRNGEELMVGLYNVIPNELNQNTSMRSFTTVLVGSYTEAQGWTELRNITYRDGSALFPTAVREVLDENHISPGVRALGLALMGIAIILPVVCLILLRKLDKDQVVLRAQPFFLRVLCVGAILMSGSIFTLSWDEGANVSDGYLDLLCILTPWFFFLGQILTFCALFTKLWRVDKVLQFRRTAVTILNVMKPTLVLLFLTLSILVTWTIVDPYKWERREVSDIPYETFGECTNEHFWAFFGPLVGLLFFAEALTFYFAWKTADVPEDFRDSAAVSYASFAQLQSFAVGIPMLAVLGTASVDATYFGRVFLIWIFAVSSVAVVVGPKLAKAIKLRRNPELRAPRKRVSVTGLYTPGATIRETNHSVSAAAGSYGWQQASAGSNLSNASIVSSEKKYKIESLDQDNSESLDEIIKQSDDDFSDSMSRGARNDQILKFAKLYRESSMDRLS